MGFSPRQNRLINALIQLAAYCIKADGHVVREEMEMLQNLVSRGFSDSILRCEVRKLVLTGMLRSVDIDEAISVLNLEFANPADRVALIHFAMGFVAADNKLDVLEQAAMTKICGLMRVPEQDFADICRILFKVNGNVNAASREITELKTLNPHFSEVMEVLITRYHSGDQFVKYGDEVVGAIEARVRAIK